MAGGPVPLELKSIELVCATFLIEYPFSISKVDLECYRIPALFSEIKVPFRTFGSLYTNVISFQVHI